MMALMYKQSGKKLSDLLSGVVEFDNARLDVPSDCYVNGLALDSRNVSAGNLFLACAGHQVHGIYFAEQAINKGANAVLVEYSEGVAEALEKLKATTKVPVIVVNDLGRLTGIIAERFFDNPSKQLLTIGITGTNGKTSCSQFIAQSLSEDNPCGVIGTIGNGLYGSLEHASHTTPDAVSLHGFFRRFLDQGAKTMVMEVSSHGLYQGRVAGVEFDVAVFTNLSRDHLDYHGSMESYSEAKKRLFLMPGVKHAIINGDDVFGSELLASLPATLNKVTYSIEGENVVADPAVTASSLAFSPEGISFDVKSPWGEGKVNTSLLGRFNVSNLLATLSALCIAKVPFAKVLQRLESLETVSGRMERVNTENHGAVVVVDYAHTPDAVEKALTSLREHFKEHKIFCVFGCGGDRDKGKRASMGAIAVANADQVVVTNDNPRSEDPEEIVGNIMSGINQDRNVKVILDRQQAIRWALENAGNCDAVIILGKGHEKYQIIGGEKKAYPGDYEIAARIANSITGNG